MRLVRILALALCTWANLGATPPAAAGVVPRTLVLRGLVSQPDGTPIAGARVSVKGSAILSTLSAANGRYALDVVMGTGAGLARGAFRVELRAEHEGKRLGLGSGGGALVAEVELLPGSPAQAEVRSNSELAVAAIATAFAQESITHAWVQADFGGGANAGGSLALRYHDRVALPGVTPLPGATSPRAKLSAPPASNTVIAPRGPTVSSEVAQRNERRAQQRRAERARLDSLSGMRAMQRRADSLAWETRRTIERSHPKPSASRTTASPPTRRPAQGVVSPKVVVSVAETLRIAEPSVSTPQVKRIEPFTPPTSMNTPDTCACRLRGTVEVAWSRPLEEGLEVELTLEGPATQRTEVTLDMGSPREFRLGPLPCGEYRLTVRPLGRLHYAMQRGGDSMRVVCDGQTQARVVLTPVRK